jgi:colanic acid biosynthesis glycosyl transferase WcaI
MSKTNNPKSVLFLSQWFPPEHAPMGYMLKELAENMVAQGWEVEVVTGFPNHPSGKVQAPYVKQRILREMMGNVKITRLWLYTSETRSFISRALNFLSFVISSFFYLLSCKKPALVFAVLQPLPLGATLTLLAKLRGFKLIFNVQDLHPDVLVDLGLITSKPVIKALKWIEQTAYRQADGLAVICLGFKTHVEHHGAAGSIAVIPNWIDIDEIKPQAEQGQLVRQMAGIPSQAAVVLYAGTIGHVSGAQVVVQAAKLAVSDHNLHWLFVGEGPLLPQLQQMAQELPNVHFLPFQPRQLLPAVQNCASISMVSLLPGKGTFSVPSKVLGYMAAGKPVVASVDANSETGHLVQQADCGVVVQPGNPEALLQSVQQLIADQHSLDVAGRNGRQFLEHHYSRTQVCAQYADFFQRIVQGSVR